ncbi:MAG: hypothetical protein DIKNOCCD_02157 [bacterium]|nr:hypothetical protein [bacterium]
MNADEILTALDLPISCRLDRRVPKNLLLENGAPTAADKRRINDGVEEIRWIAALKPTTIGVPHFVEPTREYVELAVVHLMLRTKAKMDRLNELVHRAIPYPVFLLTSREDELTLSLCHKRWSRGESDKVVLDGDLIDATIGGDTDPELVQSFRESLPLTKQKRTDLFALYQSWIGCIVALAAAEITGRFLLPESPSRTSTMHGAVEEHERIEREIALLRAQAEKEKQTSRRVELNLAIKRLEAENESAVSRMENG